MKSARLIQLIGVLVSLILITSLTHAQNFRISGSNSHSVALCTDGSVFTWGLNNEGQLGLDPTSNGGAPPFLPYAVTESNEPVRVGGLGEIFQLDAGSGSHTLALTCEGKVFAWGANLTGQLGNPTDAPVGTSSAEPVLVLRGQAPDVNGDGNLGQVSYVSGGNDESFAILEDQRLVAWGQNDQGQLGDGTTVDRTTPVFVNSGVTLFGQTANQPLEDVIQVEAGDENGYALTADGRVWSWGSTDSEALGRNTAGNTRARPVEIMDGTPLTNIVSITSGDRHALFIDDQGVVWSIGGDWGNGQRGLGVGYQATNYAEQVVGGASGETFLGDTDPIVEIAAGQAHSMAVSANGFLYTWGANGFFNGCPVGNSTPSGQLGNNTINATVGCVATNAANNFAESPTLAMYGPGNPVDNAQGVSDGDAWTFLITNTNDIYVAGWNGNGQLGLTGGNRSTFEELDLRSRGCGLVIPCPEVNLGLDFEVCPGFSHTIDVGDIFPGFRVEYFLDGVEQTADEFSVPYNTNGIPMTAPTFTITQTGTWRVDIVDERDPNLGERGCNPCPLATDELIISFPVANFADPGGLEFCGADVIVNVSESNSSTTSTNDYQWYTELSGGTLLGSSVDDGDVTISTATPIDFGTTTAPDRIGTVYVEDVSSFTGVANEIATCNSGQTQTHRNSTQVVIGSEIELLTLQLFVEGNSSRNNHAVEIYSDAGGTRGTLLHTGTAYSGNISAGDILTYDVNYTFSPGTYWISASNNGPNVRSTCTGTNQTLSNPGGTTVVSLGDNYIDNPGNFVQSPFFNLEFLGGSPYPCDRLPVTITENCPPCNKPTSTTAGPDVSVCPGEDVINADNVAGSFVDGGNPISNTSMYYVWYQSGTTPVVGDYTAFTGTGPIPNLTVTNVTATNDGDWILRVQDGNDPNDSQCYTEGTVEISLNEVPSATLSAGGTLCTEDLASNALTVTAIDGINTYTVSYTLDGVVQTPISIASGSTGSIAATTEGTYALTSITDGNGCVGTITGETADIDVHPDLTVVTDAECDLATRTATVTATITDGVPTYQVSDETPGTGAISGAGIYTQSFLANGVTAYTYSIFDGTGTSVATACDNNSEVVNTTIDCSCDITGTIALATGAQTELCPGDNTTIEVTPSGSGDTNPVYTVRLEEASNPGVAISVLPTVSGGVYSFVVSAGGTYSILDIDDGNCTGDGPGNVIIEELTEPVFTTNLSLGDPDLCPGEALNLSVVATGSPVAGQTALTYAWTRDPGTGAASVGTNGDSYSVASVTDDATHGGVYEVSVTGECGFINSATVDVTIYEDVEITTDLSTTQVDLCPGDPLALNIVATGTGVQPVGNLIYTWTAPNLVTSTTNSLTIASPPGVVTASTGNYSVSVEGECNTATSEITPVDVGITTLITTEPSIADPDLCPGQDFSLSVGADGNDLTYQWQKDGVDISGATSATLNVANVDATDAGAYTVNVGGRCGTDVSVAVNITIGNPTVITTQPMDAATCAGESAQFTVVADGDDLSYQWQKDGVNLTDAPINITGSLLASISIDPTTLSDAGDYTVQVTGNCGVVTSDIAVLDITGTSFPSVGLVVDNAVVCEGEDVVFTANGTATGDNPMYIFRNANNVTDVFQTSSTSNIYTRTNNLVDVTVEVVMTSNSGCIDDAATNPVTATAGIQVITPPTATITNPTNPADTILVADDFFNGLNVTDPGVGYTIVWSKITSTQQGTIGSPGAVTTNLTDLDTVEPDPATGVGTTDLLVTIQDVGDICPEATDTITVVRKTITIPPPQTLVYCENELSQIITGVTPIPVIENAEFLDIDGLRGTAGASYPGTTLEIPIGSTPGEYDLIYRVNNSVSTTFNDGAIDLTIWELPSTPNAGVDTVICTSGIPLYATVPTVGSGIWECDAGTLTDPTSPTSVLNGILDGTTVTCEWVTSNGTCPSDTDRVEIRRAGDVTTPNVFIDGVDVTGQPIDICIDDVQSLQGNIPANPADETSSWSVTGTSIVATTTGNIDGATAVDLGNMILASSGTTRIEYTINSSVVGCPDPVAFVDVTVHELPIADIISVTATDNGMNALDTCAGVDLTVTTEALGLTDVATWTSSVVPSSPSLDSTSWELLAGQLSTGNNTITYTVGNPGCPDVSVDRVINIEAIETIEVSINPLPILCVGDDRVYTATPTNGGLTPTYEFIQGGVSGGTSSSNNLTLTDVQESNAGTIAVRMVSSLRCVDKPFAEDITNLQVIPGPDPVILTPNSTICVDSPIRIEGEDQGTGTTPSTYQWLRDNQPVGDVDSLFLENISLAGSYVLVANNGICDAITSDTMVLNVNQIPEVDAKANGTNPIKGDFTDGLSLSGSFNGETGTIASWSQSPTATKMLLIDDENDMNSLFSSSQGGQFIVTLTAINGECSASDSVVVILTAPIRAPNVFTPNGDGNFDTFFIEGVETHPGAIVRIFNRWGTIVYETDDYESNEWDASNVPDGVYYFVVELGVDQEKGEGHSGCIHVVR